MAKVELTINIGN